LAVQSIADQAGRWGGDAASIILMGHSAGAHLVALLSAQPSLVQRPIAGAVILDSAVLDVDAVMARRHPGFYDEAFGADRDYWRAASPADQWTPTATPMMIVCSTRRADDPCAEARTFAEMTAAAGVRTSVLPQPLRHREINENLGLPGAYSQSVDTFIDAQLRDRR
jgi:acetyl esterase/lipase